MRLLAKRCLQFPVFIAITLASVLAATPDYSKEAVVIQEFTRDISFADDGTCLTEQTTVLRIQSEASVRQYGVLTFRYSRDNESVDILYVRVRKPDGTVVPTPTDNVQDVSSEITRVAPTYSDLREKQIPVKALGVGDTLEYKVRFAQTKPNVPGQFWYTQDFLRGVVVLQETLRIRWPVAKYVKVASPMVKPDVREEAGQKIYCWKTAQLEPTSAEKDKKEPESFQSSVSLTTFKSWEEIGRWYGKLQADQLAITPAMQSKAAELTKGLASNVEKQHAIYNYVSTKFRYISISFGIGRYQPHAAAAVFDNQYGDCKDKHTLFAALLKAAGIDAYPVLIGAGIKLDPGVPSPAQFNHVITVIPNGKDYVWLDTTPEVAPYGLLQGTLRGEKALVIPSAGPAILMETPADPPFPSSDAIDVQATLASDGTLKAHFDMTARGDTELVLRAVFHQIASAQWQDIVQNMVHSLGFQGTVSNVDVDNPENLEKPFHCSYDYTRANYSDWSNHRVWPPLFGIPLPFSEEGAEKPSEATFVNAPGEIRYAATLHLPKDFSAELPTSTTAHSGFATYTSRYSVKDGVLSASPQLLVGKSKVPLSDWDEYRKFAKQMSDDQNQWIQLAASNGLPKADDTQAEALVRQARNSFGQGDLNGGRYALQQAETLNPKQRGLWSSYAGLYMMTRQPDKALEAASKEVQYHPDNPDGYRALGFVQADTGH